MNRQQLKDLQEAEKQDKPINFHGIPTTKFAVEKARKRIKRQKLTGKKQPRVRLVDGTNGAYHFRHHVHVVNFKVDKLGRAYFK